MTQQDAAAYGALLLKEEWKDKRKGILERDGHRCRNCDSESQLQVHHRQYHIDLSSGEKLPPWNYRGRYLITLCHNCHTSGHKHYKVPVKFI
jgi:5-methylcytosine-specific restriction endonuclease McrA